MAEIRVIHADCRDALRDIADCSIDSCVTDPPYALVSIVKRFGKDGSAPAKSNGATGVYQRASSGFMGKRWDTGETAFDPAFWSEVLRVLRPGAHLLSFGGTRTYHRMACAIEDAGLEIRDQIAWLYGSGFPKSHDVSKAIDRHNGHERPVVGRARGAGSANTESLGEFRHEYDQTSAAWEGWGTALKPALEPIVLARKPLIGTVAANVLAHGTGALNIDGCRIEGVKPQVTQGINSNPSSFCVANERRTSGDPHEGRWPANVIHDGSAEVLEAFPDSESQPRTASPTHHTGGVTPFQRGSETSPYTDSGSAARFFYSAKADADDRLGSKHPTVKPVDLIAYLCRLITPPGGTVLDPFAGSGTTGMACMREGFNAILIEREAEYVADIQRRLDHVRGADTPLFEAAQ